jgi:hypothetical protein
MRTRKARPTKLRGWSQEDRHVIAGMRVAMRMACLPETLVLMMSPDDLRQMAPMERAAYLRLVNEKAQG